MAFKDTCCEEDFHCNPMGVMKREELYTIRLDAHGVDEVRYHNALCAELLRNHNFDIELRNLDGKPFPTLSPINEGYIQEVVTFLSKRGMLPYKVNIGRLHFTEFYKIHFPTCAKQSRVFLTFYVSIEDEVGE